MSGIRGLLVSPRWPFEQFLVNWASDWTRSERWLINKTIKRKEAHNEKVAEEVSPKWGTRPCHARFFAVSSSACCDFHHHIEDYQPYQCLLQWNSERCCSLIAVEVTWFSRWSFVGCESGTFKTISLKNLFPLSKHIRRCLSLKVSVLVSPSRRGGLINVVQPIIADPLTNPTVFQQWK